MSEARIRQRTNEEWVARLRGAPPGVGSVEGASAAAEDLRTYLRRVLARVLLRHRVTDHDLSDLVQEAMVLIFSRLDSFRGDSAFTTWATAVATRAAFTELRRRSVRAAGRIDMQRLEQEAEVGSRGAPGGVDEALADEELLAALSDAIATQLTRRQRTAILAELRGVPTVEVAARLGTNQNALYKLVHDARRKLRAALLARGFTGAMIHDRAAGRAGS